MSWLSGLLSAEIFISTGENSHFLRSGPQEATLVMMPYGDINLAQHCLVAPKPLPEQMFTCHWRCSVAFTWYQFHIVSKILFCMMALKIILLTHWGRVTHICVGKLTIIGSDNGLLPERRQAIIWTNAGILLIGPLGTNFNEILIEIQTFSLKKIRLKMSSAKCCSFRLGLNVLTHWSLRDVIVILQLHFSNSFQSGYLELFLWNWCQVIATQSHWW